METSNTQLDQLVTIIQDKLNEALKSITRLPTSLKLNHCGLMPITQTEQLLEGIPGQVTAVYIPIINDVTGDIFVFLPVELANNLADLLIGQKVGTTKLAGDYESSALKEFGNITFGVIVTQIANHLKLPMMLTVPNLATDNAHALLQQVLIEYGETSTDMLAIRLPFMIDNLPNEGNFLILFDKKSSDIISEKLTQSSVGANTAEGATNGSD